MNVLIFFPHFYDIFMRKLKSRGGKTLEDNNKKQLLELFIFETSQFLEQLEELVMSSEENGLTMDAVNEIFRIMHTIKGSSAILGEDNISVLAHDIEEVFSIIRSKKLLDIEFGALAEVILSCSDYFGNELERIQSGEPPAAKPADILEKIKEILKSLDQDSGSKPNVSHEKKIKNLSIDLDNYKPQSGATTYYIKVKFEKDSGMESLRAFSLIQNIKEYAKVLEHVPFDLDKSENTELIKEKGFQVIFESDKDYETVKEYIESKNTLLAEFELNIINKDNITLQQTAQAPKDTQKNKLDTGFISVNIKKLDMLMDITSEIIITEALLLENPDLVGKRLTNFRGVARRFMKMTDELQDIVFSLRMLPIAPVFHKMKRIVRDMGVKLNKPVEIIFEGEDTEVDKNIIEHISDPLMHIIRNSIDHGIEFPDERAAKGKPETGRIILEAKNVGNEVWITISDDGRGLDREKILEKARQIGFTSKSSSEIDDKEVYSFIFLPGFSTKDEATEFSGRGVGMDVVNKNLEMVNGTVNIDKTSPKGTVITLRIPVTLTIIDGMNVAVGDAKYTIPVDAMQEAVVLKSKNIFVDTSGNEIANIRGDFYPLVRLNERFSVKNSAAAGVEDGICIVLDRKDQKLCLFADKLLGEQQVVFKPLPEYVKKHNGISGCTLLGDGSISLILDTVSI